MDRDWTASFSIRFRNGTCIIILDKKYNIANSSWHWGSYGSIWTGSFCPYNIFWVTDRSIYCHMTLSAMNYLLYSKIVVYSTYSCQVIKVVFVLVLVLAISSSVKRFSKQILKDHMIKPVFLLIWLFMHWLISSKFVVSEKKIFHSHSDLFSAYKHIFRVSEWVSGCF